jgi:hypothetical protein
VLAVDLGSTWQGDETTMSLSSKFPENAEVRGEKEKKRVMESRSEIR